MLYGPGNDLVSATAMTAAGAHMILFSDRARHPLLGAGAHPQALHQHPLAERNPAGSTSRGRHRRRQKDHRRDRAGPAAAGDRHRQRQADQGRDQRLPRYLHLQGRRRLVKKSGHAPKGMALFAKSATIEKTGPPPRPTLTRRHCYESDHHPVYHRRRSLLRAVRPLRPRRRGPSWSSPPSGAA